LASHAGFCSLFLSSCTLAFLIQSLHTTIQSIMNEKPTALLLKM
jgi:hypothetical protein